VNADVPYIPDILEVAASKAAIAQAAEWAECWAEAQSLDHDTRFAIRLCVEEATVNIVSYAYDDTPGLIILEAAPFAGGARITILDDGRPFDVVRATDPGREEDIHSATVGGRGIRLMRAFSQGIDYERVGDRNRLTLIFVKDAAARGR
jgi:anti-sigma regulatory factor (Ser/Thr protein kinase)